MFDRRSGYRELSTSEGRVAVFREASRRSERRASGVTLPIVDVLTVGHDGNFQEEFSLKLERFAVG